MSGLGQVGNLIRQCLFYISFSPTTETVARLAGFYFVSAHAFVVTGLTPFDVRRDLYSMLHGISEQNFWHTSRTIKYCTLSDDSAAGKGLRVGRSSPQEGCALFMSAQE